MIRSLVATGALITLACACSPAPAQQKAPTPSASEPAAPGFRLLRLGPLLVQGRLLHGPPVTELSGGADEPGSGGLLPPRRSDLAPGARLPAGEPKPPHAAPPGAHNDG